MDQVKPILDESRQLLNGYRLDNQNVKEIVKRFDEVLLEKASKFSVENLTDQLETKYLLKEDFNSFYCFSMYP